MFSLFPYVGCCVSRDHAWKQRTGQGNRQRALRNDRGQREGWTTKTTCESPRESERQEKNKKPVTGAPNKKVAAIEQEIDQPKNETAEMKKEGQEMDRWNGIKRSNRRKAARLWNHGALFPLFVHRPLLPLHLARTFHLTVFCCEDHWRIL